MGPSLLWFSVLLAVFVGAGCTPLKIAAKNDPGFFFIGKLLCHSRLKILLPKTHDLNPEAKEDSWTAELHHISFFQIIYLENPSILYTPNAKITL